MSRPYNNIISVYTANLVKCMRASYVFTVIILLHSRCYSIVTHLFHGIPEKMVYSGKLYPFSFYPTYLAYKYCICNSNLTSSSLIRTLFVHLVTASRNVLRGCALPCLLVRDSYGFVQLNSYYVFPSLVFKVMVYFPINITKLTNCIFSILVIFVTDFPLEISEIILPPQLHDPYNYFCPNRFIFKKRLCILFSLHILWL